MGSASSQQSNPDQGVRGCVQGIQAIKSLPLLRDNDMGMDRDNMRAMRIAISSFLDNPSQRAPPSKGVLHDAVTSLLTEDSRALPAAWNKNVLCEILGEWLREAENLPDTTKQLHLKVDIDVDRDDPSDATAAWHVVYMKPPHTGIPKGKAKSVQYAPQPGPSPIRPAASGEDASKNPVGRNKAPPAAPANKANFSPDLAATRDNRSGFNSNEFDQPESPRDDSASINLSQASEDSDLEPSDRSLSEENPRGQPN